MPVILGPGKAKIGLHKLRTIYTTLFCLSFLYLFQNHQDKIVSYFTVGCSCFRDVLRPMSVVLPSNIFVYCLGFLYMNIHASWYLGDVQAGNGYNAEL